MSEYKNDSNLQYSLDDLSLQLPATLHVSIRLIIEFVTLTLELSLQLVHRTSSQHMD